MIDIMYYLTSQEFWIYFIIYFFGLMIIILLAYRGYKPIKELEKEIEELDEKKKHLNEDYIRNIYLHETMAGRVVVTDGDMSKICKKEIDGEWYCTRTGRKCSPNIYCTFCNFIDPNMIIDKAYENFTEEMKRKYL